MISIGWRAVLPCALALAVLLVPLAHSAHFHEGEADGDATLSATCVICQVAGGHFADAASDADFTVALHRETAPGSDASPDLRQALLLPRASRAPPTSHS